MNRTMFKLLLLISSIFFTTSSSTLVQSSTLQTTALCTPRWAFDSDLGFGELLFAVVDNELQVFDTMNQQLVIYSTIVDSNETQDTVDLNAIVEDSLSIYMAYRIDKKVLIIGNIQNPDGRYSRGVIIQYNLATSEQSRYLLPSHEIFQTCSPQIKSPVAILTHEQAIVACTSSYTEQGNTYTISRFNNDLSRSVLDRIYDDGPELLFPWIDVHLGDDGYFYLANVHNNNALFREFHMRDYLNGPLVFGATTDTAGNTYVVRYRYFEQQPESFEYIKTTPEGAIAWLYSPEYPTIATSTSVAPYVYFDAVDEDELLIGYYRVLPEDTYHYSFETCSFNVE